MPVTLIDFLVSDDDDIHQCRQQSGIVCESGCMGYSFQGTRKSVRTIMHTCTRTHTTPCCRESRIKQSPFGQHVGKRVSLAPIQNPSIVCRSYQPQVCLSKVRFYTSHRDSAGMRKTAAYDSNMRSRFDFP